jgi:hypothetical protein
MIDPVALVVLSPDAVVTTPDGDAFAGCVAVDEFGRADTQTVRIRTNTGTVYICRADIERVIDLRTKEFRPRQVEFFIN